MDDAAYRDYTSTQDNNAWKHMSAPTSDSGSLSSVNSGRHGFTVDELIERLTSPNTHDMEFVKIFLILYRKFLRPSELLDRLMDRFDAFDDKDDTTTHKAAPISAVQLRVCNVLISWCSEYWCDFHSHKMRFTLHVFLEICSQRPAYAAICQKLSTLVFRESPSDREKDAFDWGVPDLDDDIPASPVTMERHGSSAAPSVRSHASMETDPRSPTMGGHLSFQNDMGLKRSTHGSSSASDAGNKRQSMTSTTNSVSSAPTACESIQEGISTPSLGSRKLSEGSLPNTSSISFLELDNEAIAQQLNVLESEIFRRIKPRDLLQHIWNLQSKGRHAPSVAASIGHFNFISAWVSTRILVQKKIKTRAKVLGKFMKIAQILRNLNNYNTLMAVLAGVNSAAVLRLRQTRKLLQNRQSYREYQALEKLMSSEKSFALYRQTLRKSDLPCIPYLGVFLRDLLYIDENKDRRPDGTINLPKFLLMGDVILKIQNFQLRTYAIQRDVNIIALILSQPVMSEEQSYQRSLEIEPRSVSHSPHRSVSK
ncbi:ras guanine nucleotide exchange factor domain-containing protein [Phlyctochytrium arcticum]|nr:ras guanine nucleotide exchange factor domain-containing protein [Phlyctochytrium arcticum]